MNYKTDNFNILEQINIVLVLSKLQMLLFINDKTKQELFDLKWNSFACNFMWAKGDKAISKEGESNATFLKKWFDTFPQASFSNCNKENYTIFRR